LPPSGDGVPECAGFDEPRRAFFDAVLKNEHGTVLRDARTEKRKGTIRNATDVAP
jgi:hypothetical protein